MTTLPRKGGYQKDSCVFPRFQQTCLSPKEGKLLASCTWQLFPHVLPTATCLRAMDIPACLACRAVFAVQDENVERRQESTSGLQLYWRHNWRSRCNFLRDFYCKFPIIACQWLIFNDDPWLLLNVFLGFRAPQHWQGWRVQTIFTSPKHLLFNNDEFFAPVRLPVWLSPPQLGTKKFLTLFAPLHSVTSQAVSPSDAVWH